MAMDMMITNTYAASRAMKHQAPPLAYAQDALPTQMQDAWLQTESICAAPKPTNKYFNELAEQLLSLS